MTPEVTQPGLVLYDDRLARAFAPFSLTRPLGAMRAGAWVIADRWAAAGGRAPVAFASSAHLNGFGAWDGAASLGDTLAAGTILANARCVVDIGVRLGDADAWRAGDTIAAVRLSRPLAASALGEGTFDLASLASAPQRATTIEGGWLAHPWDLIGQLSEQLARDTNALMKASRSDAIIRRADIGEHGVLVDAGAVIEPHVVFDTTLGAVVIGRDARIGAFTRIAGPCVIGAHTEVLSGRISGSSIGDHCKVHGDLSATIFVGHANKAHEGFVGHSVIGRWANLGAGTTTSNLKNSYGAVRLWTPDGERDTGLTFLGSLIGDHAKLGIGTMLGTGTVIGAGANVFGTMRPPKRVPPFAWGDAPPYDTFSLDKFLDVAAIVMKRRSVVLGDAERMLLRAAHSCAGDAPW